MERISIKKGFTLAEVLITLAIIGIVAAIVVPSLLNNTNSLQLQVAFKSAYGNLSQIVALRSATDGTAPGNTAFIGSGATLATFFSNQVKVTKMTTTNTANDTVYTLDGAKYIFSANGSACAPATDYTAANCKVLVDVNADKGPNKLSTGGVFNDQYQVIITDTAVIPPVSDTTSQSALINFY